MRIGVAFDAEVLQRRAEHSMLQQLDVVVLPELMDGGYASLRRGKLPHTLHDDLVTSLRNATRRHAWTLVAGSIFFRHGLRRPTNTSLVFRRGRLIHRYDKVHLFGPTGDKRFFRPGDVITRTFRIPYAGSTLRAGVIICYDVRFPELIRTMALQRLDILFVPARWPRVRDEAWHTLLKARAIENQIFTVGCNAGGEEGGHSFAFDPEGREIFSNKNRPRRPVETFTIDVKKLSAARTLHNNLKEAVFLRRHLR